MIQFVGVRTKKPSSEEVRIRHILVKHRDSRYVSLILLNTCVLALWRFSEIVLISACVS